MVCLLSYRIGIFSLISSRLMLLKNLFYQITSLAAWDRANSSASVLDVVTVFCFVERQSMGLLNSLNKYPSVLYLVARSSVNAVSLTYINWSSGITEYSITKFLVPYRYRMARSTASWCRAEGLVRNSDSLLAVLTASALVIVV